MATKKEQELNRDSSAIKKSASRKTGPQELILPAALSVKQLGASMGVSPIEVIKHLMRNGVMAGINQGIDFDLAAVVVPAFGFKAKLVEAVGSQVESEGHGSKDEDKGEVIQRSPVVTILGHVDHGKTTLLDTIRSSRVTDAEIGGITQHIGAYQVEYKDQKITFLDTPGHAAFTAIRARGASVTDIAILVVAADDGVMPQTIEAINHAKAAALPIIVAINKTDKPESDPDKVKRQLTERGLIIEEFGGDVIAVPISAKNNLGIEDLLESVLIVAEISELTADPQKLAAGVVIEVKLDRHKGPVATILVKEGTLKIGDAMVAGTTWGKVKAMTNDLGLRVKLAGPAVPAEILGFSSLPQAGDLFFVAPDDKTARLYVENALKSKEEDLHLTRTITLEEVMSGIPAGEEKELNLIVKADTQGSVEAVRSSLTGMDTANARINILHSGNGGITEGDVLLASASKGIVLGFNVTPETSAERAAEQEGVEIRTYNIIYKLLEDVEAALKGLLEPAYKDIIQGSAIIRVVFGVRKQSRVAGVMVTSGRLTKGANVRLIREEQVLFEGSITGLRRFKDEVNEVNSGLECGVDIRGLEDFAEGDILETHRRERNR
ncbi:translation initiation factor IF-2 [SAR202 cluster bacterium AC-409-J13_OGT_754m]|nr:translation initiation factor IF-2 [SAR202 cluster bacterium AC-409-J13_OGT_754m]